MSKQVPSIGRIVHYILSARESATNAGIARPAIIVRVSDGGECGLTVFPDCHHDQASATVYVKSARFDESEGNKPGTWRWPPYVAPTGKSTTFEPKPAEPAPSYVATGTAETWDGKRETAESPSFAAPTSKPEETKPGGLPFLPGGEEEQDDEA